MATATVSVTSAITGNELFSEKALHCDECVLAVLAALGHRPSRPVTLLLGDATVGEDFRPADGAALQLQATMGPAFLEEERVALQRHLEACAEGEVWAAFSEMPAAAKDDVAIVEVAVHRCAMCLSCASEALRDNKELVLKAVQREPFCFSLSGAACRDDREVALAAVRKNPQCLQFASEACRNDREFLLQAVEASPRCLEHASAACRNDIEIVRQAVRRNGVCLQFAGEDVLEAARRSPSWL